MKAMILAAGRGERMKPLTDTCPKPLLKVADQALIEYHLIALKKAGINEVVINHAWLGQQIENYLGSGEQYGLKISYSPEQQALETAGGIVQALPLLTGSGNSQEQFLVINGDIFTDFDFTQLIDNQLALKQTSLAHLVMVANPEHNPGGDFLLSDGMLFEPQQKTNQSSVYTFSGIGIYQAELFNGLQGGKRALAPLLKQQMKKGRVSGEFYSGFWTDVGTPERLNQICKPDFKLRQLPKRSKGCY